MYIIVYLLFIKEARQDFPCSVPRWEIDWGFQIPYFINSKLNQFKNTIFCASKEKDTVSYGSKL